MEAKSSPEQPSSDVISTVTRKPLPSAAPAGGGLVAVRGSKATSGRMMSARRSRISTRTARLPATLKPATSYSAD